MVGGPELLVLVDAIQREKDIDREVLFQGLESALLTALHKKYGEAEDLAVLIDRNSGQIRAFCDNREVDAHDLGRIAAQTAKQVIIQKIREAEQDVIESEYENRIGELITGSIHRFEKGDIVISLGRAEGVLPRTEQVRGENYHVGDRIRAVICDVRRYGTRVRIVLSRTHPDVIRRLFELEVPEISEGIIEIKHLAREPGYRTKIAVASYDNKVDCVGACVGVRGSRIRNIIDELNGEKIDIIRWNDSAEVLIMNALKPAEIVSITMNDEALEAEVLVAEDQLSLAIGKKGQNVRLAAKLTGWEVNIVSADGPSGDEDSADSNDPDAPDGIDAGLAAIKAAAEGAAAAPPTDADAGADAGADPETTEEAPPEAVAATPDGGAEAVPNEAGDDDTQRSDLTDGQE